MSLTVLYTVIMTNTRSIGEYQMQVINGVAERIHTIVAHTFNMGDVEDPDLYAAQPLWEWQESEQGRWIMEHAIDKPEWHRQTDTMNYGYKFAITAKLRGRDYTFWTMKWNSK